MAEGRDIDRTAVRILGALGVALLMGVTAIALVRPDAPRDTDGVFAALGAVVGAIGGIAAGQRRR